MVVKAEQDVKVWKSELIGGASSSQSGSIMRLPSTPGKMPWKEASSLSCLTLRESTSKIKLNLVVRKIWQEFEGYQQIARHDLSKPCFRSKKVNKLNSSDIHDPDSFNSISINDILDPAKPSKECQRNMWITALKIIKPWSQKWEVFVRVLKTVFRKSSRSFLFYDLSKLFLLCSRGYEKQATSN